MVLVIFFICFIGKFSQWNEKVKHFILSNQEELDKLSHNPNYEIQEILPIGEILQVAAKPTSNLSSPSLNTQVVTGAYVTGNPIRMLVKVTCRSHSSFF